MYRGQTPVYLQTGVRPRVQPDVEDACARFWSLSSWCLPSLWRAPPRFALDLSQGRIGLSLTREVLERLHVPVLSAAPRITAVYRKPAEFRPNDTGFVILDRFIPPQRPAADSLWIEPPANGSPIPVKATVENVPFAQWDSAHPAAAGRRAQESAAQPARRRLA